MAELDIAADKIRSAQEVARRSLALFAVVGVACGADRRQVLHWLQDNELWQDLSPHEMGFLDAIPPSRKAIINAAWQSECLIVFLWALRVVNNVPAANQQCDTSTFQKVLPPYASVTVREYVETAVLRPDSDLLDFADECLRLHWEARDAKINRHLPRAPVDIEIIQERHRAINWVIGYDGAPWDEVTTDT